MKKLILAAITLTSAVSVFAQGTVLFNNRVANLATTHVYAGPAYRAGNGPADVPTGPGDYTGYVLIGTVGGMTASTTFATLIGAPGSGTAESSMQASLTPPTTFRTGPAAGNIVANTATFANIANDAAVGTFEMVVWDNSTGLYPTWTQASSAIAAKIIVGGASAPFVIQNIGGLVNTSPNIVSPTPGQGLQSFGLAPIPEPTTVALAGLGAAALLIFRRRK
jgi:hypothetical protein